MIHAFELLGEIEEPNWEDLAEQFDESWFEIYTSRALVDGVSARSRDLEAKLVTSETLDPIKTHFFEVELSDTLDG